MFYFDVGHTKAYEIFNKAKNKFNGTVPSISNAVKRDSVLASQGLDVERELYIKGLMKNEKELHKTNIQSQ